MKFHHITEDILGVLLSFLEARQLVIFGTVSKSHVDFLECDRLWETLYSKHGVSFPWIFKPLTHRHHVLRLEKIRGNIAKILPVLPVDNSKNTLGAKIVLLGDHSTGITSLVERFIHGSFKPATPSDSTEMRVRSTYLQVGGKNVKIKVFEKKDNVGRTPFSHVLYRGPLAIMMAFDISNKDSFSSLSKHIYELERHILPATSSFQASDVDRPLGLIPKVLVGLKSDLFTKRQVDFQSASNFARQNNMAYVETSAKTGESVELPFYLAANSIVQAQQWMQTTHSHHTLRRKRSCLNEDLGPAPRQSISVTSR